MTIRTTYAPFITTILFAIGIFTGCDKPTVPHDGIVADSPSNTYALSESELRDTEVLARNGNIDAMNRLANYFLMFKDEHEKGFYWLERAADAGDISTREYLLGYYAESTSAEKRQYGNALRRRWATQTKPN